ncbi:hypothetical protein NQ317_000093 [Molorchus minor]|uniref:NF-X1-type domain-containing protein n=1 Tax=Molorchus minor TaxID=1323400 RepID=A0ABQ9ISM9_9CUCU|nr:hypothetical protein NQ317_000093 [Molorchus minor]
MHGQRKPPNPWNKNVDQNKRKQNIPNLKSLPTPSEIKFKEVQQKLQAAVKRHVTNYESSSDEEELETTNAIEDILKTYKSTGGKNEYLGRTQSFIEEAFLSGAATCLICISKIKRDDSIWSCTSCYGFFHLMCIQRWSKDTIIQRKHALGEQTLVQQIKLFWCCPKCRFEYTSEDIPNKYLCFCKKTEYPKFHPYLVPHSCGEICKKDLIPNCGHKCLLLCHPGPCPPCPVTVSVSCFCGSQTARVQRCSNKEWSCGNPCGKILKCEKHSCSDPCHPGNCKPCPKKSIQKCMCKSQKNYETVLYHYGSVRRYAAHINKPQAWSKLSATAPTLAILTLCTSSGTPSNVDHLKRKQERFSDPTSDVGFMGVCNKLLKCGHHRCQLVCHSGECDECELNKPRTCSCGKTTYQIPCTDETPNCLDTCDKVLDCGIHRCNQRCHKEICGVCLETVVKSCRCGLHSKEIQCYKPYFCETKCKKLKDCNKHPCNRKCCDGNCPPCEKPCGRTLNCGNHKCNSICHRGPCYPCAQTDTVSCKCGSTKTTVPCGYKHKTKPLNVIGLAFLKRSGILKLDDTVLRHTLERGNLPACGISLLVTLKFTLPPDCHHEKREYHRCHFGDCPPCRQTCRKFRSTCNHPCSAPCHSSVLVKIEGEKPSMPWEQKKTQLEKRALPCPDCAVLVSVTCLGEHETVNWPCYLAKPSSCYRLCGRMLECGNHTCNLPCHTVELAPDKVMCDDVSKEKGAFTTLFCFNPMTICPHVKKHF